MSALHSASAINAALHGRLRNPTARIRGAESFCGTLHGTLEAASASIVADVHIGTLLTGVLAAHLQQRVQALKHDVDELEVLLFTR